MPTSVPVSAAKAMAIAIAAAIAAAAAAATAATAKSQKPGFSERFQIAESHVVAFQPPS